MNLATATPADIDTRLVELDYQIASLDARAQVHQRVIDGRYSEDSARAKANSALIDIAGKMDALLAEQGNLHDEYRRRGGWTRLWVVPHGHGHSSQSCHTLHADTITVIAPRDVRGRDLSGANEKEIVEAIASRACTYCYPSAPVDKPSTVVLPSEDDKVKARAEREAKRAKREAAKAAKAITNPDGSKLRYDGWIIETESEAQRRWVEVQADAINNAWGIGPERHEARKAEAEPLLAAIAAKHGETVEQARERLAQKVTDKAKRDAREMAATAKRLRLS
ncbi:hypothetical protein [Microbispora sp. NPDC049125]|uniref:hypothetical protein n=1 Tax=Microbispora sp. NPDC049125 TaxID=3154929 RepID=UPI0034654078